MAKITRQDQTPAGLRPERAAREAATSKRKVEQLLGVTVADGESPYDHVFTRCLELLAAELASDPDGRGYTGMTPEQIAIEINEGHTTETPITRTSRLVQVCFPDAAPANPRALSALLSSPVVGAKIRLELESEDRYRAHAGDDDAVIALLTDTTGSETTVYPPRIPVIFRQVPFAPNAIDAEDVAAARATITLASLSRANARDSNELVLEDPAARTR